MIDSTASKTEGTCPTCGDPTERTFRLVLHTVKGRGNKWQGTLAELLYCAPLTRYYYAQTDDLGVLCVDEIASGEVDEDETDEDGAAALASLYPHAIYFAVSR